MAQGTWQKVQGAGEKFEGLKLDLLLGVVMVLDCGFF